MVALFHQAAYEGERDFVGGDAGGLCSGDRQSLGLAWVWVWECHGAVGGCPGALAAQFFFLSSPLCHRPI